MKSLVAVVLVGFVLIGCGGSSKTDQASNTAAPQPAMDGVPGAIEPSVQQPSWDQVEWGSFDWSL